MTPIEGTLRNYSTLWTVLLVVVVAILGSLFIIISSTALHPVQVLLIFLIGLGGVVIFYYLRKDLILAIYYWIILLWPYLGFTIANHPIKTSYLGIPVLCFVILINMFVRNLRTKVYLHPIFTLSLLYTMIILISTFINLNYVTSATYSFLGLWILGFAFFTLYLGYISTFNEKKIISLAENTLYVFVWVGLIAVIVAVLEYWWPVEIHEFYSPRVGEESWGCRGGIQWFIDLKRTGSIIGAPNAFGMFLVMTSIIAWYRWKLDKNPLFLGIIPIYFAGILLFSNARQAIVTFYIVFIWFFLYERRYITGVSISVVSAILAYFIMPLDLFRVGYTPSYEYSFGVEWPSIAERLYFWGSAVNNLFGKPTHLIYGFGVANSELETLIARRGAHNIIFTNFHNYGFIGLIIIGSLIFAVLRYARREAKANQSSYFYVSFLFIIISMIIQSLFDDIFYYNSFIMFILFPLIAFFIRLSHKGGLK